jgi:hypothetical protein
VTFLAYELARQGCLCRAELPALVGSYHLTWLAPLLSRVAAGEVTRDVWRCDLVSGGMGGSGQGQHEFGGGGAGRGCGRDHALGGQDGLTERRGRPWRATRACR